MKRNKLSPAARLLGVLIILLATAGFLRAQSGLYVNISGPAEAAPGDTITYTITYANNGITIANDVVVTQTLPNVLYYTFQSASDGGLQSGNTVTWTIGSLSAGLKQFRVKVIAGIPGVSPTQDPGSYYMPDCGTYSLVNSVSIAASNYSTVNDAISTNATQTVQGRMSDRQGNIKPGNGSFTIYLMSIVNTGNVTVKYNLSYLDIVCPPPIDNTNHDIPGAFYDIGNLTTAITTTIFLKPGEEYPFFFKLLISTPPNANAYDCKTVTAVSSICNNPTTANVTTFVRNTQAPQLDISKSDNPDPVYSGKTLKYTIFIYNAGGGQALNTVITETYSSDVTFVSAFPSPTSGNRQESG